MTQRIIILGSLAFMLAGCGLADQGPSPSTCYGQGQPGCIEKYGPAKSVTIKAQNHK